MVDCAACGASLGPGAVLPWRLNDAPSYAPSSGAHTSVLVALVRLHTSLVVVLVNTGQGAGELVLLHGARELASCGTARTHQLYTSNMGS